MALTDIRAKMKTQATNLAAGGYTITAARIILGYDILAAGNTLLKSLVTDGPLVLIRGGAAIEDQLNTTLVTYEVLADLYIGLARTSDQTLANECTLADALRTAWKAGAMSCLFDSPEIWKEVNPMVVRWPFRVEILDP